MSLLKSLATPALFLSHGAGPAPFLDFNGSPFADYDKNSPSAVFMRSIKNVVAQEFPIPMIKAIVVITAHWEESQFTIDYQDGPTKLYYDYGGFPKEAYAPYMTYPAPSDALLAEKIHQILSSAGIKNSLKPRKEGFDHGVFVPLKQAFPEATIPVVQMSLHHNLDIASHIQLGEELAPLREEGVLIVGSGQITHSGRSSVSNPMQKAEEFIEWYRALLESTTAENYDAQKETLIRSPSLAPHFAWAHPRTEHFIPLVVAFGANRPTRSADRDSASTSTVAADGTAAATTGSTRAGDELATRRIFSHIGGIAMATDNYMFTKR
jgi:aromatic ring-opening dioxygenase catalytic subunit (LigB family)